MAPRLGHPEAVWVFDGSDFPKQGRKSAGVARQYCGRLGKVANCQGGMFLAYVSPLGRALVDKRLYLPKSWTSDQDRCAAAGVPDTGQRLGPGDAGAGPGVGLPQGRVGCRRRRLRDVADLPGGTGGPGDALRAGRSGRHYGLALDPAWTSPEYPGFGRPRKPKLRPGQRRTEQRGDPDEAWREITVAQGSQGPRTYRFSAQRVGPPGGASPARNCGSSGAGTWTAASPATTCPTLPSTTLETLAYVGGSSQTEFETEKGDVGLDEYETRSWAGWHHHIAMCLLGGAFLLSLQQDWGGKDAPDHEATGVPGGAGDAAPGAVRARSIAVVAGGYAATERARRSHERRRSTRRESRMEPPPP